MNKPITEKDFENSVYQFLVLNSERQEPDNDGYSKRAGTHCFELAKRMAIDFQRWISKNNYIEGADFQKGIFFDVNGECVTETPEQLFEQYQQKK